MVQDAPGAKESGPTGQSAPWAKSAALAPLIRNVAIVSGPSPVLVSKTGCASEVVPTERSAKVSNGGDNVTAAAPRVPAPVSETV